MRSVVFGGLMIASLLPWKAQADVLMNMNEAYKNRSINIQVIGTGTAYRQAMVRIKNTLPFTVAIQVEAGRRFIAFRKEVRDLLVTKNDFVRVPPFTTVEKVVYSLDCEKNDRKATRGDLFSIGKMAEPELVQLAQAIEKNGLWDREGAQDAVYVLSDGQDLNNLPVQDWNRNEQWKEILAGIQPPIQAPEEETTLKGIKASAKPINAESKAESDKATILNESEPDTKTPEPEKAVASKKVVYQVKQNHKFSLPSDGTVSLILYDPGNEKALDLIKNKKMKKGKHEQKIEFNPETVKNGSYALRLFLNGEMIDEKRMHLSAKN